MRRIAFPLLLALLAGCRCPPRVVVVDATGAMVHPVVMTTHVTLRIER